MSETSNDRLAEALSGRYRIERQLGEGGMAKVYLAHDVKHDRNVALKVLKPELAAMVGAERFLAEIKTTAKLQHPHILPLFDSGEADHFLFYAMPYLEGESLRERLDRERQLPVDDAVRIATDMAEALEYAHSQGIVHRDIKPGNVMFQAGRSVIADFGIALAFQKGGRLTETGLSVGTSYYMSPEQATGDQEVGPASDTYSLGCVLYEMLVGEPPFMGRTTQAVLGKILQGDPVSATSVRKSLPANVDAVVRKALERLPVDRFATCGAFARALHDPAFRHGPTTTSGARRGVPVPLAVGAAVVAIGLMGVSAWALANEATPSAVERFESPFRAGQEPLDFGSNAFTLSRDGSVLVYRGPSAQASARLWARHWDDLEAHPIRETEGAVSPTVSPDGGEVAFVQGVDIRVASMEGGTVRTLMPGHRPMWGEDGYIYGGNERGVARVPAAGGEVEQLGDAPSSGAELWPAMLLPDHDGILVTITSSEGSEIGVLWFETGQLEVVSTGSLPHLVPSGHLVHIAGGDLVAARFDPGSSATLGVPVVLVEGIVAYSMSDSGRLFYSSAPEAGTSEFVWVTRGGQATPVDPGWSLDTGGGGNIGWSLSPDGTRLALRRITGAGSDIWIKELDDGPLSRLTVHPADDRAPRWSPDGLTVTFLSDRETDLEVWQKRADGVGEAERLFDYEGRIAKAVWSPDGERLVIRRSGLAGGAEGERDIYMFQPGVDEAPVPLIASAAFMEQAPAVSPDGKWLAYSSNETGRNEIFVRPFPNVDGGKWQVSTSGGTLPLWARNGDELFFVEDGPRMVSAHYSVDPAFRVERLERLFDIPPGTPVPQNGDPFDVTADGQRFLMARVFATGGDDIQRVVLVTNFMQELERLVAN